MKNQALFSSKDKSKKIKWYLLQFLFGTLRANKLTSALIYILSTVIKMSKAEEPIPQV